jgi:transmembrane sensor
MKTELIFKMLSGDASDLEKEQINRWIQESEQNKIQYEKTVILWQKIDGVYDHRAFDESVARKAIYSKIALHNRKPKKNVHWYKYAAAATILLMIGVGFFAYLVTYRGNQYEQLYSSGNAVKEIILADGSHIWLNSNSSIALPKNFSLKNRKAILKGEAYFEIKHDEVNPFKITTGETVTEDLGTSFNIKLDTLSGDVNVLVSSGKVAFYNSDNKINKAILLPGDYASFLKKDEVIKTGHDADQNLISWKTGILKFYNTPIDKVCDELSRHFNKKIISTISAKDLKLTGTFSDDSLEAILATIELTLEVHVNKENNEYRIEN